MLLALHHFTFANSSFMSALTALIWIFLLVLLVWQHFQLLSAYRQLQDVRSISVDLERSRAELQSRVHLHEEDERLQHVKHGVTLHSLDCLMRDFNDAKSELSLTREQTQLLEQSLADTKVAHLDAQKRIESLEAAHAQSLVSLEVQQQKRLQLHRELSEQNVTQLNQHVSALTHDLQQSQAALQTAQNDRALVVQVVSDLRRKIELSEIHAQEMAQKLKDQLTVNEQVETQAQNALIEREKSQTQLVQLQTRTEQLELAHRQSQEAWQQEKSTWVKTLEQQQMVHQGQLQELTQSHQTGLNQAVSAAAQELQSLEKSLLEKMQGMAQTHAQEHARSQNELSSLRQQFQAINQSRAELESQLHASNHQKQTVHDKVMDFEKRWSQIAHEQQQAHEMLLNLKSLVLASSSGSVS